ncbi:hypothetical protein CAEBREN_22205 [Caenorhabditis brenneri]|uniref:Uncharacterized protein n=1 Tax=Caenorhabditis brenneri TaxID=135651 RepID=G0N2E4_CAEBE|nr:hypothetical protein CAEBREN_22205 [Caenorhabditis brenneri]
MQPNNTNRTTRGFRRPPPTAEELARGAALKAEGQRAKDQIKGERAQFDNQWPEIRTDFEPGVWREAYQRMHADTLAVSIVQLQQLEELTQEEAERKIFDILDKATFVESHLILNGAQRVEKLFENMELATGDKEKNPFQSPEDLSNFLKSMAPIFKIDVRTRKWKNTGMQTRKFCQVLMQRLQLGDVIDDKNFEETYNEFKSTIEVTFPAARNFAEREYHLDISSYCYLATVAPAFKYDKPTGRLSLNPDVRLLALHLPILARTLHSNNPQLQDRSRLVTTAASYYGHAYPNCAKCSGVDPSTNAVKMNVFRNKFENLNVDVQGKQYLNVTSFVRPNDRMEQLEAVRVEPDRLDYSNNFVTGQGPVTMDQDGKKKEVDFKNLEDYLKKCKKSVAQRKED